MMKFTRTIYFMLCMALMLCWGNSSFAQISIPNSAFTDAQDFSTLASSGSSSTVPTGWAFFETGSSGNNNGLYAANNGSNNAGDTYSYGLTGDGERAFGGLQSGTLTPTVGVCYTNNTGSTITGLTINYTGETWRVGTADRPDGIQFQYNQNTTAINGAGTWTSFTALNYFNPGQATGSGTMQHSALISSPITGLNIAAGATFCFRWVSFDASGADDGIAVDDYSLNSIVTPPPCEIISYSFGTPSACNDNGTPADPADDYFTVDVSVLYSNSTNGDSLILTGGDLGIFRTTRIALVGNNVTSTFSNVWFRADGAPVDFTGQIGTGSNINCSLPGTGPAVNSCSGPTPPANDLCVNAQPITPNGGDICGTTIGAGADNPNGGANCDGPDSDALGSGVWYTFTGDGQDWDFFFPASGDWDPEVNVYSGSCGALTCVIGDDDSGGGLNAAFSFNTMVGVTYYVYVHPACDSEGCGTSDFCFTATTPVLPVVLTCPMFTDTDTCLTQAVVNQQFSDWLATASASGGCDGVLTNNNTGAPSACGGFTTVTFTYTSTCEPFTTTCQATFSVPAPPTVVLTCPTNTQTDTCLTQAAVDMAFDDWLATASASGGCDGVLTNNNTGAPSACGGSTTVTFTYTSACAPMTTTCQATFTVPAPPTVVLNCPVNRTEPPCLTQDSINSRFNAWLATASGSGGCDGVLTNNNAGAPSVNGGSTTVTFTYTSSCAPMTTTCQATFTVSPPPPVVLNCPANTTELPCLTQDTINAHFAAWLATASASGGCDGVLTNNNIGAPPACGGSTTVTFTYTSTTAPTTTTCQATFTVPNATQPVLSCPAPTTASACLTQAQLNTAYANWLASASATGGCGGGTVTNNAPAAPLICNPNSNTITVTFTYAGGTCQTAPITCTSTFTVPAYPTFNVPANGANTVACPSQITQPTPPAVVDGCGKALTPSGPTIVNSPNPITCEGTRTYTWTYTDCAGLVRTWSHVVTVERQPFGVPANGGATVACPDQTDAQPTAPVVLSNCGEVLTPVVTSTAKPGCEGNRNWNFKYTDCEGNTATWTFIYTVEYLEFNIPASEVLTVECPLNAVQPTPPTVLDNCGKLLTPTGPAITSTNNAGGCEASRSYSWTYKDCEGTTKTWSRTFNFQYTADFFVYPDGEDFVGCLLYAQPPVPPTIYDNCGQEIKVTGPTVTGSNDGCSGVRKYTYVYTNCGGFSHTWSYTYHANDNEPPVGNCPGGSLTNSVDVTNLSCPSDVPCPDTYDFSSKVQELLAAGDIYDVCSGDDLVVELDSWTALWDCADPDGDGNFTFGRTFYFRIADQCGNEMPSLCGVTYSGACLPLETFPQGAWGNVGGEPGSTLPGNDTTDLQVISTLLAQGPLTIGGTARSITLTDAQCVVNLLPGIGNPAILSNCQQVNCSGCNPAGPIGMKNILAANTIALTLNMRYNVQYNGLTMNAVRNQGLGCITIDQNLKICAEGAGCKLRIYESNGTVHDFPYTIGGLLDLANLYLNGGLVLSAAQSSVYAAALNNSITNVNAYWHGSGGPAIACDPGAGANAQDDSVAKSLPTGKPSINNAMTFSLAPNPAGNEVTLKLSDMVGEQEVSVEIYNQLGQRVLVRKLGQVAQVSERIDLSGIGSGLYIVSVRAGGERFEQKLVVSKD